MPCPLHARPHSVDATECGQHLSPVPPSRARIGQGHMHTRSGRRARFCRRRLTAGAAERATRIAVRRGFQGHRGRPRGFQSWPGGGCRCVWRACGRQTSFLNIHDRMTHATSRGSFTFSFLYPGERQHSRSHNRYNIYSRFRFRHARAPLAPPRHAKYQNSQYLQSTVRSVAAARARG